MQHFNNSNIDQNEEFTFQIEGNGLVFLNVKYIEKTVKQLVFNLKLETGLEFRDVFDTYVVSKSKFDLCDPNVIFVFNASANKKNLLKLNKWIDYQYDYKSSSNVKLYLDFIDTALKVEYVLNDSRLENIYKQLV